MARTDSPIEWNTREYWDALSDVFLKHFGSDTPLGDSYFEASWIDETIGMREWDAWDHSKELRNLEELERALGFLERFDPPWGIYWAMANDALQREEETKVVIGQTEYSSKDAVFMFQELKRFLQPSIEAGKKAVKEGHRKGRTNWDAVVAIDAVRTSWWRCTGEEAPQSINPASPFGRFAQDIFDVMGIKGNPSAAMEAWRRVQSWDEKT